ncbi:MAG: hypothetical protein AB7W16_11235 [Candidatus Obscuribacterales bacterium]
MTQPVQADLYDAEIRKAVRKREPRSRGNCDAEIKLLELIIRREALARFTYNGDLYKVAPSEILYSRRETEMLRAFQLQPSQGWKNYEIAKIENLEMEPPL